MRGGKKESNKMNTTQVVNANSVPEGVVLPDKHFSSREEAIEAYSLIMSKNEHQEFPGSVSGELFKGGFFTYGFGELIVEEDKGGPTGCWYSVYCIVEGNVAMVATLCTMYEEFVDRAASMGEFYYSDDDEPIF
jgi:hypothetical protein